MGVLERRSVLGLVAVVAVVTAAGGCTAAPRAGTRPASSGPAVSASRVPPSPSATDRNWVIDHPGPPSAVEGYADHAGVLAGNRVRLFVSTTAARFSVRAYRFGWYGGSLARLVWTSPPVAGRRQPAAVTHARGMVVAPWRPSVTVPTAGWPPGSYQLQLDAGSTGRRYIPLVVESRSVAGRVVLVQSTTSYQAYNTWGGRSLYHGPDGRFATRARAVSFDRPYHAENGAAGFFQEEQPLVSLAERLGLPLAYRTSIDLDRDPRALDGAVAVVTEGHDEYWSPAMRRTLTRARDHGANLAFFGANAIYRKVRFEPSPLGQDRVEVNYKVPQEDPLYGRDNARVTGNWPDPPNADPESNLVGEAYGCDIGTVTSMTMTDPGAWVWAGTGVRRGESLRGLVGVEVDADPAAPAPGPLAVLARSPVRCVYGAHITSAVTYYVAGSGAGVLDAGTEHWVCALSDRACVRHLPGPDGRTRRVVQAVTANILRAFAHPRAGGVHPA